MKKVNTKTSKKIVAVILAAVAAFSVMGCSVETNFTSTETTTTTAEAMASTEEETGDVEEYENVPMSFTNNMGCDVAEFHIKMSNQDKWSDNFLKEGQYFDDGTTANGVTVDYDDEERFMDICVVDSDGDVEEFGGIELPAGGADEIEVVLGYDEAFNTYTVAAYAV